MLMYSVYTPLFRPFLPCPRALIEFLETLLMPVARKRLFFGRNLVIFYKIGIMQHLESLLYGPLAQSVEQRTFNPLVLRSSRRRPTNFAKKHIFS